MFSGGFDPFLAAIVVVLGCVTAMCRIEDNKIQPPASNERSIGPNGYIAASVTSIVTALARLGVTACVRAGWRCWSRCRFWILPPRAAVTRQGTAADRAVT